MKQVLKWVAIVLGVFLLVAIVASPFFFFRGYAPMMGGYRDGRGLRMMWFGGVWAMMLGRVLFPLLIIGLLVWGGYALGRGASRGNNSQRQVAASATPAAAPSVIEAPSQPAQPTPTGSQHFCAHCGKEVQEGWVACPYCGENL
jgi:hypothetical protein